MPLALQGSGIFRAIPAQTVAPRPLLLLRIRVGVLLIGRLVDSMVLHSSTLPDRLLSVRVIGTAHRVTVIGMR
eukprot:13358463-Alexandrium_andersonii.AAC.1